jgi:hypothetical protein
MAHGPGSIKTSCSDGSTAGILLATATVYLCCERFARAFKLRLFWQPIPICTFAEAWNSGDLALRYTYVEFKVVATWNAELVRSW